MHKVQLNVSTINKTGTSGTGESAATIERCPLYRRLSNTQSGTKCSPKKVAVAERTVFVAI